MGRPVRSISRQVVVFWRDGDSASPHRIVQKKLSALNCHSMLQYSARWGRFNAPVDTRVRPDAD
jgi:hypothetical protein